jgi:hypothetical protein
MLAQTREAIAAVTVVMVSFTERAAEYRHA